MMRIFYIFELYFFFKEAFGLQKPDDVIVTVTF